MERIFYKTDLTDAYSGYPIYIFDTSYLPAPEAVDYDLFIPTLMQWLPKRPYVVILFSCGLNKINWVWGITFLKAFLSQSAFGASNAENVHRVIAVHESWFVKSVSQIFTNFLVSKKSLANLNSLLSPLTLSNKLLISCDTLSDLSAYVDITQLKISLNVYRHDYQTTLSPRLTLQCPFQPIITDTTTYSSKVSPVFYHHFYQIFSIIDTYADQVELLFHRPGKKVNTEILFNCLMRNQFIWINDWDLNCLASCFKRILTEVSPPLINIKDIVLPMKDDLEYTLRMFDVMMIKPFSNAVLFQIVSLCYKIVDGNPKTKHTSITILRSLSHALTHESLSNSSKDSISITVRFLKNVLHHWKKIAPRYQGHFKTVQQIVDGEDLVDATIDELYNMSYDITTHTSSSSEDENGHMVDTEKMLASAPSSMQSVDRLASLIPHGTKFGCAIEEPKTDTHRQVDQILPVPAAVTQTSSLTIPSEECSTSLVSELNTSKISRDKAPLVRIQYPPQKYKFERSETENKKNSIRPAIEFSNELTVVKKPVIRGRKVSELTRIFEERSQAMKILDTM